MTDEGGTDAVIDDDPTGDDLTDEVRRVADGVVAAWADRADGGLDFSERSLAVVEELLAEASDFAPDLPDEQVTNLAQQFGCYILEVARRAHGGRYRWYEHRNAPVLVVGEPAYRIALHTWDKAEGRLRGDEADNIPFFYQGFADRVRSATEGADALYV